MTSNGLSRNIESQALMSIAWPGTYLYCLHTAVTLSGLNISLTDGFTPAYMAVCNGHAECLQLLLEHAADPNLATTDDGTTPAFMAAQEGPPARTIRFCFSFSSLISSAREIWLIPGTYFPTPRDEAGPDPDC